MRAAVISNNHTGVKHQRPISQIIIRGCLQFMRVFHTGNLELNVPPEFVPSNHGDILKPIKRPVTNNLGLSFVEHHTPFYLWNGPQNLK